MTGKQKSQGRPPKDGPGQTRIRASFTLPPAAVELIACISRDLGMSKADVVTAAMVAYAPIAAKLAENAGSAE